MLTITTTVTGGQWFLPVLVLIILTLAIYQYAKTKQMEGLMKFLRVLEYIVFLAILVLVWIIYAKGRSTLFQTGLITIIMVEIIGEQLLDSKRDSLKKSLGNKYTWLRWGFDFVVLLILGILLLSEFNFSPVAWIIIVILLGFSAWVDFAWSKYK